MKKPDKAIETPFGVPVSEPAPEMTTDIFLPIIINNRNTGEDQVRIKTTNDGLVDIDQINADIFFAHLEMAVSVDQIDLLKKKLTSRFITKAEIEESGIQVRYNIESGGLMIDVPNTWMKTSVLSMEFFRDSKLIPNATPDFLSGYLNLRGNRKTSSFENGQPALDQTLLSYNGAIHSLGATVVGGGIIEDGKHKRRETALIIPWDEGYKMFLYGDGTYTNYTSINTPELTGTHFYKKSKMQKDHQEIDGGHIELEHRSTIEIYRNAQLFRTIRAEPGKFYLSNLPLQLGQNVIRIVITDEVTGMKTEKIVEDYLPLYGVPRGEIETAFVQGFSRNDVESEIVYTGPRITFFGVMYGITNTLNTGFTSYQQEDYTRVALDERLLTRFGNFSFQFLSSETKNFQWGTAGIGSFASNGINQYLIRNFSFSYERAGSGYEPSPKAKAFGYAKTRLTAAFVPYKNISLSTTYENLAEEGVIDDAFFVSVNRPFKINNNWSGGVSLSQAWGTNRPDELKINFSLTFSENIWSGRFSSMAENTKDGTSTRTNYVRKGDVDYSASFSSTNKNDRITDLSAEKNFNKGRLAARFVDQSSGRKTADLLAETAIAFTNKAIGLSQTLNESFIIFKSGADPSAEFEVLDQNARPIMNNGSFWSSIVIPVRNFSTVTLTPGYTDPAYFTMDSSSNTIYQAGFKTGSTKFLTSDDKMLALMRIVDPEGNPVINTSGKVVCEKATDVFYDSIFTNLTGDTEFYARRGASCKVVFNTMSTDFLDLTWPSKYRDFGIVPIK